ncbi:MAG TPA: hydantoinase/oxoprolinase family protein [Steroidobacteraceae bacterium]|nr:hydantoinase/oxoprolinase family protein [Steroidobacteraceae bacterium]
MTAAAMVLGVDVGGTNTDAVILHGNTVIASAKRFTTENVGGGLIEAVKAVLQESGLSPQRLAAVMIGTTQFINAFVQRRDLAQVAAVRVSLPKTDGIPPMVGWPEDLIEVVGRQSYLIGGGSFYDGRVYAPLDEDGLKKAGREIKEAGVRSIALTANFAPVRPDIERQAADILRQAHPDADITLSHEVGGLGLIDRENAAIINACLRPLSRRVVSSLIDALGHLGIRAPLYLSQNDGTLVSTSYATRFPIVTCSAGPTNSIRGAAFLTGLQDAVVMDIGGTTTDLGFLVRGFPRETATAHPIGGVRTNFRMPDVLSIPLGGGTRVHGTTKNLKLGPDSVGYELTRRGRAFGGTELTTTDVAVRCGQAVLGDPALVAGIDADLAGAVMDRIHNQIEDAIDQMKTSSLPVPVVVVGGGSILLSRSLRGTSKVIRPPHAEVANAVGAAISMVSGRVDRIFDFSAGREPALEQAKEEARAAALAAGAVPDSIEIVELTELPMTHMKTTAVQVKVRAVGKLHAGAL